MPFVVVAELRAGFAIGRRGIENERVLRRFLLKDGVHVLFADDQTTLSYANVFRQLRFQGTPIPTNDIWISALVLQHNLALLTGIITSTAFPRSSECERCELRPNPACRIVDAFSPSG